MNRKRLQHTAGILRDLGLAAEIASVGDLALGAKTGGFSTDAWGICLGVALLAYSVYIVGIESRRRRV